MNAKNSRFQFLITVLVALVPLAIAFMIGMKVLGEEQEKNKHQDRQIEEIKEGLQTWIEALENTTEHVEIDFVGLRDTVDRAVHDYALRHPKKLGDALRVNL